MTQQGDLAKDIQALRAAYAALSSRDATEELEVLLDCGARQLKVTENIIRQDGLIVIPDVDEFIFLEKIFSIDNLILQNLSRSSALDHLKDELFYSWTCGEDVVRNLILIGKIFTPIKVDKKIDTLADEVRFLFALDNYIGFLSVLRSLFEYVMVFVSNKYRNEFTDKKNHVIQKKLRKLVAREFCINNAELDDSYNELCDIVHSRTLPTRDKALSIYSQVRSIIHRLFLSQCGREP